MKRAEILDTAKSCVCGEREQDYGTPENNFALIGKLWEAYMGVPFSPKDVAMMMALLKVARIKTGKSADSFVDLAGYAACAGEIVTDADAGKLATPHSENADTCVSCGAIIPEGRHICESCMRKEAELENMV